MIPWSHRGHTATDISAVRGGALAGPGRLTLPRRRSRRRSDVLSSGQNHVE